MTGQAKAKKTAAKRSAPNKKTAQQANTAAQWGGLMGDGVDVATAVHEAVSQSIDVVSAETLAYSNRAIEQSVTAASALAEARSIGDVVDVQTRVVAQAWHEAFDYWTKLGESAAETAQKGFSAS